MYWKTWKNHLGLKTDKRQIFLDICGILLYLSAVVLNIWWLTAYVLFFVWLIFGIYVFLGILSFHPEFRKDIRQKDIPYSYEIFMALFFSRLGIFSFGGWYLSALLIFFCGMIHYIAFYSYIKE